MSGGKKDLTRIEDLAEYLHDLEDSSEEESFASFETPDTEEEGISFSDEFTSEPPSLPSDTDEEEEKTDFSSSFENSFETSDSEAESESDFSMPNWDSEDSSTEEESSDSLFGESTEEVESTPFETTIEEPLFQEEALPEIESEPEPEPLFTPDPTITLPEREYKSPETFSDLKSFSESSSFTTTTTEANPSFSVLLKEIRYLEDVNDILSLLKEFNLLNGSEEQTKERLMRGSFLVPRISEYLAIFLAHKLRRFDIDIQIGHSDEIHPPKHQEKPELGIVSKHSLYQNQGHHFQFEDAKLDISQIIVAATPSLEGYQVLRYQGVASEHQVVDADVIMDEESSEVPKHYKELAQRLKAHALKANANAVVGLNYQLTPLPNEFGIGSNKYRLTCTGNLVWVNKL